MTDNGQRKELTLRKQNPDTWIEKRKRNRFRKRLQSNVPTENLKREKNEHTLRIGGTWLATEIKYQDASRTSKEEVAQRKIWVSTSYWRGQGPAEEGKDHSINNYHVTSETVLVCTNYGFSHSCYEALYTSKYWRYIFCIYLSYSAYSVSSSLLAWHQLQHLSSRVNSNIDAGG